MILLLQCLISRRKFTHFNTVFDMNGYLREHPPILHFVTIIGFFMGFFVINLLAIGVLAPKLTGYTIIEIQEGVLTNPALVGPQKWIQFFYSFNVFLLPAVVFSYLWQPYPATYLGLKTRPSWMQLALTVVLFLCALPFANSMAEWNQTWNLPKQARELQETGQMLTRAMLRMPHFSDLIINLILMAILPAIAEELFFRGVLQRVMINMTRKRWLSVVFTAVIFSALHLDMLGFMPRIALGVVLGGIYLVTGNLWLAILAHVINNGMLVVQSYLFQHGLSGTDPMVDDFLPWYFAVISLAVTAGLFWALIKRSPDPIQVETYPMDDHTASQ